MLYTKYKSSRPSSFKDEEFWSWSSSVLYSNLCPLPHPGAGPVLTPWGIIFTHLVEIHKEMLYTKYQSSRPSSFKEEEEFWNCLSLFFCSNLWPLGRSKCWLQGHHMNTLGRGPLEDASYQISKLEPLWFGTKRFLKISFFYLDVKSETPQHRTNFHSRAIIWSIMVEGH